MAHLVAEMLERAFPSELFSVHSSDAEISTHLKSQTFAEAPRFVKLVSDSIQRAIDQREFHVAEEALRILFDKLSQRSCTSGLQHEQVLESRIELSRKLFMSTVLILDAAFNTAHPNFVARFAVDALLCLGHNPLGALAIPQLFPLEQLLLWHAGESAQLHELISTLLFICDANCVVKDIGVKLNSNYSKSIGLVIHWSGVALGRARHAPQLWPLLPTLVDASSRILGVHGSHAHENHAFMHSASASIVFPALSNLNIDIASQREIAAALIMQISSRCNEQVRRVSTGDIHVDSLRAEMLCNVLFCLLPLVKEPLLCLAMNAVQQIFTSNSRYLSCLLFHLQQVVSATHSGRRKECLIQWMLQLQRSLITKVRNHALETSF